MGKSSLLLVLGMSALIGFFILKLTANSKEHLATTVNMFEQTQARLIANTGVEIYLEKLYANPSIINTTSPKQSLFNGEYFVKLEGTLPYVRVTSTAEFQGVTHTSVADAYLEPISFPNIPGGMYISTDAVVQAKEVGDMEINGSNHDVNGNIKGTGMPAVVGVAVDNIADKNAILSNLQKPDKIMGLIKSTGTIGYPSVDTTSAGIDWSKIYQYLSNAADQTFIDDIPNSADLGTLSSPKITLVNADASSTQSIMINKGEGAGILVVNGDVKFAGNFNFKGIILCYKNTSMKFESTGTNQVLGGIIAAGKTVEFKLTGTMNVKYSLDVLNIIRANLKSNGFTILKWYE